MRRVVHAIGFAALVLSAAAVFAQEAPEIRLWNACRNGDVATAREMLDKGVSPNHKYEVGITPIAAAAMRGQAEIVKLLLERGADPNVRDETFKATPLGIATFFGHMSVVQVLLPKATEDLDLVLKFGAMFGAPPLVEAGLRGKPTANDLAMAWVLAKRSKKDEIAAMLEKAGAKPAPTMTPEMLARFAGDYRNTEATELLLVMRDGKLIGTGGLGMGSFFEEELVFITPNVAFVHSDPFQIYTFEGAGEKFDRVSVTFPGGSYIVERTKGAAK